MMSGSMYSGLLRDTLESVKIEYYATYTKWHTNLIYKELSSQI